MPSFSSLSERIIDLLGITSRGQATKANSLPVTLASDQDALPVTDGGSTLSVDDGSGSLTIDGAVSVSNLPATQAISAAALPLPSGAATAAKQPALGTAGTASADVLTVQGVASMTALKVDASATTQPISGTITVQDGGGAVSIDDNGSTISIDDGGGAITVDGTVAVTGTFWQAAQPVTDNGGSLTVDGTVTANAGSGVFDVTPASPAANDYLPVRLTDGSAFYSATGGGGSAGTEYTEGDTDASITGTAILWEDGSDTLRAVSAAKPLPVGVQGTVPVSGTFWQATQPVSGTVAISGTVAVTDNSGTLSVDDGGGSLTVDGTVSVSGTVTVDSELTTADLDTGAGTDTRAVVGLVYGASGGGTLVSTTDPLPIGDNGGSLTVDGTFWQATQPISGTVTANAGTGTLAVSLAAGAAAPAKAEDVASADADVGIPAMAVRKATPANTSGTDGDYEMLQMSAGRLWASATIDAALPAGTAAIGKLAANDGVDIGDVTINNASGASAVNVQDGGNALTVDNGGTFAVQAAQSGTWTVQPGNTANTTAWKVDASSVAVPVTDNSGSLTVDNGGTFAVQDSQVVADNAGFTDGTTKVFAAGFIFDEVAGTALTENDAAAGRIDSKRAQVGVLEDATTRGQRAAVSAGGALKVDNSAVTQPVSGTFWQATQPVSGTVTASNVTGNVAHDGVDSGNPLLAGYQAIAHGTNPTAVAAADRTVGYANRAGVPFVMGGHPNVITRRDPYTAAQTDTALVTVSAGTKIVVTRVLLTCANSNSVDVSARVGFGAANTPTGAGVVASHPGIPKGGGFSTGDGSGILGVGADGEDLRFTCSVPTTGSIEIVTSYYTIES